MRRASAAPAAIRVGQRNWPGRDRRTGYCRRQGARASCCSSCRSSATCLRLPLRRRCSRCRVASSMLSVYRPLPGVTLLSPRPAGAEAASAVVYSGIVRSPAFLRLLHLRQRRDGLGAAPLANRVEKARQRNRHQDGDDRDDDHQLDEREAAAARACRWPCRSAVHKLQNYRVASAPCTSRRLAAHRVGYAAGRLAALRCCRGPSAAAVAAHRGCRRAGAHAAHDVHHLMDGRAVACGQLHGGGRCAGAPDRVEQHRTRV